jgi:hypothetical protein
MKPSSTTLSAPTRGSRCAFSFLLQPLYLINPVVQAVLEQAATSGAPETFIQTVVTKLFLLSNDANSSLDVAAHALQVHSCGVAISKYVSGLGMYYLL